VAPVKIVSMIMGAWYLSSFFGNWLSGVIGSYFPDPTSASAQASTFTYEQFFMLLAAMGVGAGLLMLAVNRPLRKVLDARTARVDLGKP
jgi:POT family proton-dependent oligopeptide transporter